MFGTGPGLGQAMPRRVSQGWGPGSPFSRGHVAAVQLHRSGAGRRVVSLKYISSLSVLFLAGVL